MTKILDGKRIAGEILRSVRKGVEELSLKRGVVPGLAFITVGADPASLAYVAMKEKACVEAGILSRQFSFRKEAGQDEILKRIKTLNSDDQVHAILIQLPLPIGIDTYDLLSAISPEKDVDGFHPVNMGRLLLGQGGLCPCTPMGIVELLIRSGEKWEGKDVVIIGRSNIVGKPLAAMLMQRWKETNATVTVCHRATRDIAARTREADVIVVAIGRPRFLRGDMVREGAIVVDVGVNRIKDDASPKGYRIVGDVDYEEVSEKAGAISPVPGGVGPMTIAMLMKNTLLAAGGRL